MTDDPEKCITEKLPNEILHYLFQYFHVPQLIHGRRVCKRWKCVIDALLSNDKVWEINCLKEFPTNYLEAKLKTPYCERWYDVYKSLSLWKHLNSAMENVDEFCHADSVADEIRSITALKKGLICVQRRTRLVFYDLPTQEEFTSRSEIPGEYLNIFDLEDTLVLYGNHLQLYVYKYARTPTGYDCNDLTLVRNFQSVKHVVVHDKVIYFVTINNLVYSRGIDYQSPIIELRHTLTSSIISLSIYNNVLHVLTVDRIISAYENNNFAFKQLLDLEPNIVHTLWTYNLLEYVDWSLFYIWMAQIGSTVPDGPMRFICSIRVYGDLFLVGSQYGLLRIYYKPFINGQLDLFKTTPVRQYSFSQRIDIPILSLHPILRLEVVEDTNGHRILVAMPRKILIINMTHEYGKKLVSKALVPYKTWENVVFTGVEHHVEVELN